MRIHKVRCIMSVNEDKDITVGVFNTYDEADDAMLDMKDESGYYIQSVDLIETYCEQNGHRFEGRQGINRLAGLLNVLGYHNFESFLEDNPGAMEAILNFISELEILEWKNALCKHLKEGQYAE